MSASENPHAEIAVANPHKRLRIISRLAEWLAFAGIGMAVVYEGYLWFAHDAMFTYARRDILVVTPMSTDGAHALAWLFTLIPAGFFVAAMWLTRNLFRRISDAWMFDSAVPRLLRLLGILAIGGTFAGVAARTLAILTITGSSSVGQQHLVLSFGSNEIVSLIVGLLLFAFALVMQEVLRIAEDNRSII